MLNLAINFSLATAALFFAVLAFPGLEFEHILTIVPTCFILGLINFLIRPMMVYLGIDVTILKIGIFSFVINWLMFNIGIGLLDDFDRVSWMAAFFEALILGLIQAILWGWDMKRTKPIT